MKYIIALPWMLIRGIKHGGKDEIVHLSSVVYLKKCCSVENDEFLISKVSFDCVLLCENENPIISVCLIITLYLLNSHK